MGSSLSSESNKQHLRCWLMIAEHPEVWQRMPEPEQAPWSPGGLSLRCDDWSGVTVGQYSCTLWSCCRHASSSSRMHADSTLHCPCQGNLSGLLHDLMTNHLEPPHDATTHLHHHKVLS